MEIGLSNIALKLFQKIIPYFILKYYDLLPRY